MRVIAFYRFARFDDPAAIKPALLARCEEAGAKGTILLAPEGINGTIAAGDEGIEHVLAHLRDLPGCADLTFKQSRADTMPFYRMKVRLKREIITMGEGDLDPAHNAGTYVKPEDWNALIDDPDTILIDTRNDYEVAVGTFRGAIDPKTKSFGEFPDWLRAHREEWEREGRTPKIAMFCTGGIRCEKSTALARMEGLADVYHLDGGILNYLEKVDADDSRWEGECFVFDERVSVKHGLEVGDHSLCRACRMPVSPEDRASPQYVEGERCPACHHLRSDEQRARYAERQRQVERAKKRGQDHIGARQP